MQIQHNPSAMTASRQLGINSSNFRKNSQKLASGYKINIAADGAAQLAISEKMRWQIRGLKRSIQNAEDGANFIQVADGAMNEIHDMIHRMQEIAVQSLNDTNTALDRAALAAEFEQLQCEIDRINTETDFNTQPVFEHYAASYYKIEGNRVWTANQIHTIEAPDDDLHIKLPASYNPNDYRISVPSGNYTTQELIDEIEDALSNMNPENPGFTLEFTKDGFCDLIFESEEGEPTEIDFVDGHLSYLIYDTFSNNTSAGLLGTTQFEADFPLEIVRNQNDTLSFRIETSDGKLSDQLTITIPTIPNPKKYTREEMIELLNQKLAEFPEAAGVVAKPYGDKSIQITGGTKASITSLKGNMFNIEKAPATIYSSVFYDNINKGICSSSAPSLTGAAYYNKDCTTGITIEQGKNDTFAFTLEQGAEPIKITLAPKTYVIDGSGSDTDLIGTLNKALQAATNGDVSAKIGYAGTYINSTYVNLSRIVLQSKTEGAYRFTVPTSSDATESKIWQDTYNSLFRTTNYEYMQNPYSSSGSNPTYASYTGAAQLTAPIDLDSQSLSFNINGNNYDITIPKQNYNSLTDLTNDLQSALKAKLPDELKDKITIKPSGNRIDIRAADDTIKTISVNDSAAYKQLFTRHGETSNEVRNTVYGNEQYLQGSTAPDEARTHMAVFSMPYAIPEESTTLDTTNNNFRITLNNNTYINVDLTPGTYTRQDLIKELNNKLSSYPVEASLSADNKLVLTTTPTGSNRALSIYVNSNNGTIWKSLLGSTTRDIHPTPQNYLDGTRTIYRGINDFSSSPSKTITLDNKNCTFTITTADGPTTITLTSGQAYTQESLRDAIKPQLPSGVIVDIGSNGCIYLEAEKAGYHSFSITPSDEGSFYKTVLGTKNTTKQLGYPSNYSGSYSYTDAYIVGRHDLKDGEVKIVSGLNDVFTVDLTFTGKDPSTSYDKELTCTIPPGTYTYDANTDSHGITTALQKAFQEQLDKDPKTSNLQIEVGIGKQNTGVTGSIDANAMSITIKEKKDANNKPIKNSPAGQYLLDGIRGSASYFTFYKTTGSLEPSYIIGIQDITKGVTIGPDNNELILSIDDVPYHYQIPEGGPYTADEIIGFLNDQFKNGPNPPVPLVASVLDGKLKISYEILGPHVIDAISGNAKGTLFYQERSRENVSDLMLQVGAEAFDGLGLKRLRVGTVALGINSVTISKPKYANKALVRLDNALNLLSAKRSSYGALQNRIEHIITKNEYAAENAQASESKLRDADMAVEMIEFAKHRILMQATEAVLAQANQLPNIIMNLLR